MTSSRPAKSKNIGQYILAGKEVVPIDDIRAWGAWFEKADRHIGHTPITSEVKVSTVFLGLDHSFSGGTPVLFETMVFGGNLSEETVRYTSYDDAQAGHEKMVRLVAKAEDVDPDNLPVEFTPSLTKKVEQELELRWPLLSDILRNGKKGSN